MRRARPARASIGAARMLDDILPYYESELTALRKLSREFAGRYPKIASRLLLEGDPCEDPHVEPMIVSFAFLTGRIHKKLDAEFPQITDALLSVPYPHYLRPVQSISTAQLLPAPTHATGELPRSTPDNRPHHPPVQGATMRYT